MARRVTATYSPQILLVVGGAFLNLAAESYFTIANVIDMLAGRTNGTSLLLAFYVIASLTALVVCVTASCEATSVEANRTALLTHRLVRQVKSTTGTYALKSEPPVALIRGVLLRVRDGDLIEEIAGGVTTYLVILLQFQLSSGGDSVNSVTA